MSRKYKFNNKEGLYFVSFATVYWLDVFTRDHYCWSFIESLNYCRRNKGMEIFAWCIMPSVKSSMDYPPQALFFLLLTALKNIHVAMAMLIFLCLARNKNYFGLTETPHLTLH